MMRKDTSQKNATFKLEITILVNRHINKFILIRISGTYLSKNLQTFFNLFLALQIFFGCNLDVDFSGQDLARAPQLEKKTTKDHPYSPRDLRLSKTIYAQFGTSSLNTSSLNTPPQTSQHYDIEGFEEDSQLKKIESRREIFWQCGLTLSSLTDHPR